MLQAVAHCHKHNVIHRDIKLENFVINKVANEKKLIVKLIDFGISAIYDESNPPSTKCGTIYTVAPEVLKNPSYDSRIDIWSLGIILFEMLTLDIPFNGDTLAEVQKQILFR